MRLWPCALLVGTMVVGLCDPSGAATDISAMQPSEIAALQKRLSDSGCYAGPLDGTASRMTSDAVKRCPDQDPVLRIETGMHVGAIKQIAVDAGCHMMVTGSDDKTVRVWSLPDGTLQRTIRLPIDEGDNGRVYAVALTPDGRTLAVGGWDAAFAKGLGTGLYIIDLPSGSVRRIGPFDQAIFNLAISPDGKRIAATLGGPNGVRVIDAVTGQGLMADRVYGADSFNTEFGPDGSLYVSSYDGFVRRYDPAMRLTARVKGPDGARPSGLAVDPAGRRLALGYHDTSTISILDARSLKPLGRIASSDPIRGNFSRVAWTPDGRQLVAGGSEQRQFEDGLHHFMRRFDGAGRTVGDTPYSTNSLADVRPCGADMAFGATAPNFGLMSPPNGQARILQEPVEADMRHKVEDAFAVSADGRLVRFGLGYGSEQPVEFSLADGTLTDSPALTSSLRPALVTGLPVESWHNQDDPSFAGRPIGLPENDISHALAVREDRGGFVLGTEMTLSGFDGSGQARWRKMVPAVPWGVAFAAAGSIVAAAQDDGTVR